MLTAPDLDNTTGAAAFRAVVLSHDACAPGQDYVDQCVSSARTLRQIVEGVSTFDPMNGEAWCVWSRTICGDDMDDTVKTLFSDVATANDPRMAAHLDIILADASASEHAMLRARWYSKNRPDGDVLFPTIEQEVADGTVILSAID